MALMITTQCINCDMCLAECPNAAISEGATIYEIEVSRCTECVGFYARQTCVDVCPIACIVPHPAHIESQSELWGKFRQLQQSSH